MPAERCDECGFDSDTWSDAVAVEAIAALPGQWVDSVSGLSDGNLRDRPVKYMWCVAEYIDHVREVLFGMRFVLDSAVAEPGIDLGNSPKPQVDPSPRSVDVEAALCGVAREANNLRDRFDELSEESWSATAIIGGDQVDGHWIARHAVHDARHHLLDVERLHRLV